jgi:hypothetical protein
MMLAPHQPGCRWLNSAVFYDFGALLGYENGRAERVLAAVRFGLGDAPGGVVVDSTGHPLVPGKGRPIIHRQTLLRLPLAFPKVDLYRKGIGWAGADMPKNVLKKWLKSAVFRANSLTGSWACAMLSTQSAATLRQ